MDSDEQLVAAYRLAPDAGSGRAAIDELFRRYHAKVALWCYRATRDRERAADLAQDVFVKAFRSLESFRGDAKFSTWLYVIARNQCFSELRTRATFPMGSLESQEAEAVVTEMPAIEEELIHRQGIGLLRRWVAELLDADEKKVMMLHYGEELPLAAITSLLGLKNRSGAKAFIVSARRKLDAAVRGLRESGLQPRTGEKP